MMICMDKAIDYHKFLGPDFQRDIDLALSTEPTVTSETTKTLETDPKTERVNKLIEGLEPIIPDYDFDQVDFTIIPEKELTILEASVRTPQNLKSRLEEISATLQIYGKTTELIMGFNLTEEEQRLSYIDSRLKSEMAEFDLTDDQLEKLGLYFQSVIKKSGEAIETYLNEGVILDFTFKNLYGKIQDIVRKYEIELSQEQITRATTTTRAFEVGKAQVPDQLFDEEMETLDSLDTKTLSPNDPAHGWINSIKSILSGQEDGSKKVMTTTLELGKIYGELSIATETEVVTKLKSLVEEAQGKLGKLFQDKTNLLTTPFELEGMLRDTDEVETASVLFLSQNPEALQKANKALHKILNIFATPILTNRLGKEVENTENMAELLPGRVSTRLDKYKKKQGESIPQETERTIEQPYRDAILVSEYFTNFDNPISKSVPTDVNEALIRLSTDKDPKNEALRLLANSYRHTLSQIVPKKDPTERQEVPVTPTTTTQAELETAVMEDANPELEEIIKSNEIIAPVEINGEYEFDLEGFKLSAKKEGTKYRVKTTQRDSGVNFSNVQTTLGTQLTLSPLLQSSKDGVIMETFDQILRRDKPMNFFFITIDGKPHLLKVNLKDIGKLTQLVQSNRDNIDALLPIIKNALNISA
jgi:hypothetical protein